MHTHLQGYDTVDYIRNSVLVEMWRNRSSRLTFRRVITKAAAKFLLITLYINYCYIRQGGYVMAMVCLSVCLSANRITRKAFKRFSWNPVKLRTIERKNPLNFGVGPTQNGRKAAILDFYYKLLSSKFTSGACSLQAVRMDDVQYAPSECWWQ